MFLRTRDPSSRCHEVPWIYAQNFAKWCKWGVAFLATLHCEKFKNITSQFSKLEWKNLISDCFQFLNFFSAKFIPIQKIPSIINNKTRIWTTKQLSHTGLGNKSWHTQWKKFTKAHEMHDKFCKLIRYYPSLNS